MGTQTMALLVDAYRELRAKKVFTISLAVSGLIVLALGLVGMTPEGTLSVLWFTTSVPLQFVAEDPAGFYKTIFMALGLKFWLTWGATILALASTAGVFPDFLEGGAIDLALSKPIGRTRLFLTKYLASMLFVAMQVTVFTALAFMVIGVRGGAWEPAIFLAVPLVTIFYSYLYSVCALLGVVTRSAMTALILTIALWLLIFMVHSAESGLLFWRTQAGVRVHAYETRLAALEASAGGREEAAPDESSLERTKRFFGDGAEDLAIEKTRAALDKAKGDEAQAVRYHGLALAVKTVLPKTTETIGMLERWLIEAADMDTIARRTGSEPVQFEVSIDEEELTPEMRQAQNNLVALGVQDEIRSRSGWWIIGTSLLFEGAVLALAAWRFGRRDY